MGQLKAMQIAEDESSTSSDEFEFFTYFYQQVELELMSDPDYPTCIEYTRNEVNEYGTHS